VVHDELPDRLQQTAGEQAFRLRQARDALERARTSSPQCTPAFRNAVVSTSSVGMLAKVFTALLASASDPSASVPQTRIAASSSSTGFDSPWRC
jgi:hypothetical protein